LHIFAPAEFASVVKKDTAVVAGDVIAKTKATVEQNLNKASEVATLAARCALADYANGESERERESGCATERSRAREGGREEGMETGREREKERKRV